MTTIAPDIVQEAKRLRARAELDRISQLRLVAQALTEGSSQASIAVTLGISQPTVSRLARQIRAGLDVNQVTPAEIINRYAAGEIDENEMFDLLLAEPFTVGVYDPTPTGSGYVRGTWDDVQNAVGRGLITDEQYNLLATKSSTVTHPAAR